MGADFIDYIVGDQYLMPSGFDGFYQEKIIYLPGSYQPNDDKRPIDEGVNRKDHHLPEDCFVFCCFNKPYKITPAVFNCWLNILKAVENSVLWLQSSDQAVVSNLKRLATKEGVAPSRLIFAERVPTTAAHLARYKLADVFLDTFPYTAHTTANDALWAGLPLLGLSGQTFAARVSESLLCALGLADWVMHDLKTYQDRAIKLGSNPEELVSMRTRLEQAKARTSLYKPAKITKWLESGLKIAHDRYIKGLAPDHIVVPND
jgi:predicted O-linked N-acetylglucosamine transferase (SPINDLY family)